MINLTNVKSMNQLMLKGVVGYGKTIRNPNLLVVNVGSRENPSYLPAQVYEVLPGQPAMAKLSPQQTSQMMRFAVRRPTLNAQAIIASGGRLLGFEPTNPTLVCTLSQYLMLEQRS